MTQWEYLVVRLAADDMAMMNKHLGELGVQRWQAYAVVAELPNHVIYLKRKARVP